MKNALAVETVQITWPGGGVNLPKVQLDLDASPEEIARLLLALLGKGAPINLADVFRLPTTAAPVPK